MKFMTKLLGATAAVALSAGAAAADPALIFDLGGKFDKSFNEAAWGGAERWAAETGGSYGEVELQSEAQREQALRRFAEAGYSPIVANGFSFEGALREVAPDYPDTRFVITDGGGGDLPNVQSAFFAAEQGSYIVGVMAAMASNSGTVGFIGGMDLPFISDFGCGFVQGVHSVNPDAKILWNMTGVTPTAWNDPVKGAELTLAQISQGADVIYHAAGGTGEGVLQAAADNGVLGIGVDKNQNGLHPGSVLTSMLKRVDNMVYDVFTAGNDVPTGFMTYDVASGGIGYAMDENNASLVSAEMAAAADAAAQGIVDGSIQVHLFSSDMSCPGL
jgi:basic membrane protein A